MLIKKQPAEDSTKRLRLVNMETGESVPIVQTCKNLG